MAAELPVVGDHSSDQREAGNIEIPLERIASSRALDEG
jgi:hypothetical protein